jgi:hypothetical protein
MTVLATASNNLPDRRTVVSRQSQHAETRELEVLITESLPGNSRLLGASLNILSGVQALHHMPHECLYDCKGRLFWLHYSGFQELRVDTDTVI